MHRTLSYILPLFVCILISCTASKKETQEPAIQNSNNGEAAIEFREKLHNYGKLNAGEEISYSFKFTNAGSTSLKIDSITTDCGCIHIDYPKEAVKIGESNYVDILFDSSGEYGRTLKQFFVYYGGKSRPEVINIVAEIDNAIFK